MRPVRMRLRTGGGREASRRGGVLAIVLIAVLTIGALSAALLQVNGAATRRQLSSVNIKLAFYMAEAGLAEGYGGVVVGKTGNVGTEEVPAVFGEGLFWVEATENVDGTVTLASTGMVGNGRAELSMVVQPMSNSVATLGMFSEGLIDVRPGATIDGFDSAPEPEGEAEPPEGEEPPPEPPTLGRLRSNGPVQIEGTVEKPTVLVADVMSGPEDSVVQSGEVTIEGMARSAVTPIPLPPVTAPVYTELPGLMHTGGVPHIIPPSKTGMEFLHVGADSEVVIQGPAVLVLRSFRTARQAQLTFDTTGGPIGVYVTERFEIAAQSVVSVTGDDASQVVIQAVGQLTDPITLAGDAAFYGIIYAPETALEIYREFELFGSLVAGQLQLTGPVRLHFDRNLLRLANELTLPELVSWRIVELGNPVGMRAGMDPFAYLGLDKTALPDPKDCHASVPLKLDYIDNLSVARSYDGPESAFDWSTVQSVDSITRNGTGIEPKTGRVLSIGGGGGDSLMDMK